MFPHGGEHPCAETFALGGRRRRRSLKPSKAKSLEEGGRPQSILLDLLELEDVVWESCHHGLDRCRHRRGVELEDRDTSRVAVGLERCGFYGNLRMLFIVLPGSSGLASLAIRATTEVGPRGGLRCRGGLDDSEEVSDWLASRVQRSAMAFPQRAGPLREVLPASMAVMLCVCMYTL